MERCKHQTGSFFEIIEATHQRDIENGVLDPDSFNNEYEGCIAHEYHCKQCGKSWRWTYRPRQKWLEILFLNAYSND